MNAHCRYSKADHRSASICTGVVHSPPKLAPHSCWGTPALAGNSRVPASQRSPHANQVSSAHLVAAELAVESIRLQAHALAVKKLGLAAQKLRRRVPQLVRLKAVVIGAALICGRWMGSRGVPTDRRRADGAQPLCAAPNRSRTQPQPSMAGHVVGRRLLPASCSPCKLMCSSPLLTHSPLQFPALGRREQPAEIGVRWAIIHSFTRPGSNVRSAARGSRQRVAQLKRERKHAVTLTLVCWTAHLLSPALCDGRREVGKQQTHK